jgi:hypothetical protein
MSFADKIAFSLDNDIDFYTDIFCTCVQTHREADQHCRHRGSISERAAKTI